MVKVAAIAYVIAVSPNINKDTTAINVPMIEAGKRTYAFFSDALAVGSIVTIAVITANMGGRFSHIHIRAVRKVEIPVFIILSANMYLSGYMISTSFGRICICKDNKYSS